MSVYTDPPPSSYLQGAPFFMPTNDGNILAIALSRRYGTYVVSIYTTMVVGIFGLVWQFFIYLFIMFYPTEEWPRWRKPKGLKDGIPLPERGVGEGENLSIRRRKANRYVALVGIWNSSDPVEAMSLLAEHAFRMLIPVGDLMTCSIDLIALFIGTLVILGGRAAGVFLPALLVVGSVAPANPSSIFFIASRQSPGGAIKSQKAGLSAVQRAVGAVKSAEEMVTMTWGDMPWSGPKGEEIKQVRYRYNITGVDFGLQRASGLFYSVEGACTFEYGWLDMTGSGDDYHDTYISPTQNVTINQSQKPSVTITTLASSQSMRKEQRENGNMTYGVFFDTTGRMSPTPGNDPIYLTETIEPIGGFTNQVMRGRPALSCWESPVWTYKGNSTKNLGRLIDIIGEPDLPLIFRDTLLPFSFSVPKIISISQALGGSALISSVSSTIGLLDAESASWGSDMEYLIRASYILSRDIFRNTAMPVESYGLMNDAISNITNKPQPGVDNFVLSSTALITFSVKGLIIIPLCWLAARIIMAIFGFARRAHKNSGKRSRLSLRAVGLQAVQLYRMLDEEVCSYRDDWRGRKGHLPYILRAKEPKIWPSPQQPKDGSENSQQPQDPIISNSVAPSVNLFAAPKVVKGRDDRYHIKFVGPSDNTSDHRWVFRNNNHGTVADEPEPE